MGFTNTQYANTIANLVQASESKLNNPYYKFTDKQPTPTTYYKQNKTRSTLDCASQLHYAHVSDQSALRYNKIIDFYLYGIEKITVDYDLGDNGIESNPISGDAIILPNTIEPLPGDFFSINYVKEDLLFKVDYVTPDTLDTGSMLYKIEYHLELVNQSEDIEKQVIDTYRFIADNVGTEYNCLISSSGYDLASSLDALCSELTTYFNSIFFNSRLQTYVYKHEDTWNFYDPYMIEFLRRNKILSDDYIMHQTTTEVTFPYEYTQTFFYALEKKDPGIVPNDGAAIANLITDINSLFVNRLEDYYQVKYNYKLPYIPYQTTFTVFAKELINGIKNNTIYDNNDSNSIYNLIISYMNGNNSIDYGIIDQVHKLDYTDNATNFYLIPIYIYILKRYISSNILSSQTIN